MNDEELMALVAAGRKTAKIRVVSDGTPDNTLILADGKVIPCTSVRIDITARELMKVTFEVYVHELEILFDGTIIVQRKEPDESVDPPPGTPDGWAG